MKEMYRQGDILLVRIDQLPKDIKKKDNVLAIGETTGHNHILDENAIVYKSKDGMQYIQIQKEAQLTHQEHNTINIPAGNYKVIRQKEYTPKRIRQVQD